MQLGFHFGFKKSKAYGLCGVMLAILFLGMSGQSAKADEMLSPTDTSSTLKESTD
ncbi:MAG: putative cross-wall-targeting lipoprotein signal domain-containing protein, partial [Streptococcus salivarius]|nr:putative cross-wall-targeting lipoprotein signal domain-containing protein [Streptococcus salivarius]